jgi:hypothetical protein
LDFGFAFGRRCRRISWEVESLCGLLRIDQDGAAGLETQRDVLHQDQAGIQDDDVVGLVDLGAEPDRLVVNPDERLHRRGATFHPEGRERLDETPLLEYRHRQDFTGDDPSLSPAAVETKLEHDSPKLRVANSKRVGE